ncbi:MAG: hypothetical protein M1816_007877 [Peltula sp. TS41687]|nr:MAG: hypothetical protein M1816_007877 [Peltula sp. TS41687]
MQQRELKDFLCRGLQLSKENSLKSTNPPAIKIKELTFNVFGHAYKHGIKDRKSHTTLLAHPVSSTNYAKRLSKLESSTSGALIEPTSREQKGNSQPHVPEFLWVGLTPADLNAAVHFKSYQERSGGWSGMAKEVVKATNIPPLRVVVPLLDSNDGKTQCKFYALIEPENGLCHPYIASQKEHFRDRESRKRNLGDIRPFHELAKHVPLSGESIGEQGDHSAARYSLTSWLNWSALSIQTSFPHPAWDRHMTMRSVVPRTRLAELELILDSTTRINVGSFWRPRFQDASQGFECATLKPWQVTVLAWMLKEEAVPFTAVFWRTTLAWARPCWFAPSSTPHLSPAPTDHQAAHSHEGSVRNNPALVVQVLKVIFRVRIIFLHVVEMLNNADRKSLEDASAEFSIDIDPSSSPQISREKEMYDTYALLRDSGNDACILLSLPDYELNPRSLRPFRSDEHQSSRRN